MLKKLYKSFINLESKVSIKRKIFIYFLLIVFLPTCTVTYTIYNIARKSLITKIENSVMNNLNKIEQSFLEKFSTIDDLATSLYLNNEFVDIISSISFKSQYLNFINNEIFNLSKFEIIDEIESLDKILKNYNFSGTSKAVLVPSVYILARPEYNSYNYSKNVYYLGDIEASDWYNNIPYRTAYSVTGSNKLQYANKEISTLRIAKRIYSLRHRDLPYAGLLTVDIGADELIQTIKEYKLSEVNNLLIYDKNGEVVLSDTSSTIGSNVEKAEYYKELSSLNTSSGSFTYKGNNKTTLISFKKIKNYDWTIVSFYPSSKLYGELTSFKNIIYIIFLISVLLGLVISWILSDSISYPISTLVKSMKTVREGNFEIDIKYSRNDEFAYLINQYKKMVNRINELIQNLYVSELSKKEAELKALQSQINPHFLYNTLDSINLHALRYNVPEISTMITSLSDFFRYSLSKGKTIITIKQEKL